MARKGLSELVVDTTSKHYAVLLQYRTKCCRKGLTLPPQSKPESNTTYMCHFWGVNYSKTLLAAAKSCKKTCFDRIIVMPRVEWLQTRACGVVVVVISGGITALEMGRGI
jgi:hypothetical protein